jgi:hypothetical protein
MKVFVINTFRGFCGERGIRTPGGFNTSTVFKTAAIDRSAISPGAKLTLFFIRAYFKTDFKKKEIL